ncbi:MAG: hypothetical protein NC043_09015 [Muribaculaceae bacterium]|nr:hypothetical protein [Muribaculaceae bacterium]
MLKYFTAFLALLLASIPCLAQNERPEVRDVPPGRELPPVPDVPSDADPIVPAYMFTRQSFYAHGVRPDWSRPLRYQPFVFASNPTTVNAAGVAPLALWSSGGVIATGERVSMPGLMGVESGSIMATQTLGRLTVSAGAVAEKYGYFRGLQTVYGLQGVAMWRFNDRLSLTLFGSWYTSANFTGPAMMPYMSTSNFGGYLSWDFAEHFGVDAGAQTQYNNYTGRWETRPIVRPYYKFSNDAKIGIDFGGLIYDAVDSHRNHRANPTVGPPVPKGAPPVRMDRR